MIAEEWLNAHGFTKEEPIDPHVARYTGAHVPQEIKELLHCELGDVTPLVYININDNSDFHCEKTWRVELGLANHPDTFDLFGSSSPFASTLSSAYREAAYDFLYRRHLQQEPVPAIVAWRRRLP